MKSAMMCNVVLYNWSVDIHIGVIMLLYSDPLYLFCFVCILYSGPCHPFR